MNARELRIGNYFKDKDSNDIEEVDLYELEDRITINGKFNGEPVPLTEEWLLKFGFEIDTSFKDLFIIYGKIAIEKEGNSFKLANHEYHPIIKHLHQLQNLYFSLCGEELELKNI